MDRQDQFRLLQPGLEACILTLKLGHAWILGRAFGSVFSGRRPAEQTLAALPAPIGEVGQGNVRQRSVVGRLGQ